MRTYDVIIVGGGAAGFFSAITAAENLPGGKIAIFEKSLKLLSKVKVSGGGRCNVTHACFENYKLIKAYPRGGKFLKTSFSVFSVQDTVNWFEKKGVSLKVEEDGRMFPVTDDSQTIVNCLLQETRRLGIEIHTQISVQEVKEIDGKLFNICCLPNLSFFTKKIIVAVGGSPKPESYSWIYNLGHRIVPPVPSLFTFNIPGSDLKDLSGISVPDAAIRIVGSKLESTGPLLITHWGLSGPAVLKLSAWGAREFRERGYQFSIHIKWVSGLTEMVVKGTIEQTKALHPKRKAYNQALFGLPARLWQRILWRASVQEEQRWVDLSNKQINLLMENLIRASYQVSGKTTFKEEFVTCGGVDLQQVDAQTMQSKIVPGLFFVGEVLDIDGITGGYNFQNAWTTGYIAGKNAALVLGGLSDK